jgi:hypothetical protein
MDARHRGLLKIPPDSQARVYLSQISVPILHLPPVNLQGPVKVFQRLSPQGAAGHNYGGRPSVRLGLSTFNLLNHPLDPLQEIPIFLLGN